jgi:5-methylcytosine-specific restriction enzyme subunit McrC
MNPKHIVITFLEYESKKIDYIFKEKNTDKEKFIESIKSFNRKIFNKPNDDLGETGIFNILNNKIKASRYVGFGYFDKYLIQVLPKIYSGENQTENEMSKSIEIFIKMYDYAYDNKQLKDSYSLLSSKLCKNEFSGVHEVFMYLFSKYFFDEVKKGVYREYLTYQLEDKFLRGKLLATRQLNKAPYNLNSFSVEKDEFTDENYLNSMLLKASFISQKFSNFTETRKNLLNAMDFFENLNFDFQFVNKDIIFNRLNKRFEPAYNLAKIILQGLYKTPNDIATGFFLDMNKLFEEFIYKIIKKESQYSVSYQDHLRKFVSYINKKNNSEEGPDLIPDILVKKHMKTKAVIDVKYKNLKNNGELEKNDEENDENSQLYIGMQDLYQLYAYLNYINKNTNNDAVGIIVVPKSKQYNSHLSDEKLQLEYFDGLKLYILPFEFGNDPNDLEVGIENFIENINDALEY